LGTYTFTANQTTHVGLDPVYLPDVRDNASGWTTKLSVRNNSTTDSNNVLVTYYYYHGGVAAQSEHTIAKNGRMEITPSVHSGFNGAAVIMASDNVSVATLHEYNSSTTIDGYAGVEKPTTTVYVPILQKNNSGWYSHLYIQNTSNQEINVDVEFIANTGNDSVQSYTISPWGFKKVETSTIGAIGSKFIGSAKITSSQPLAVSSTQYNGNSQLMATSNSQAIGTLLHGPLIQNNNSGYLSGITVQNASATGDNATVKYYNDSGNDNNCPQDSTHINAGKNWIVFPAPSSGGSCATILSGTFSSGEDLAVNVNQLQGTAQATTYAAISEPSKTVYVPRVVRNSTTWNDGFVIRNTESSSANVTVKFYNTNGTQNGSALYYSISGDGHKIVLGNAPNNFNGSAVVTSNRNIAVSVNNLRRSGSGDVFSSYPADHD